MILIRLAMIAVLAVVFVALHFNPSSSYIISHYLGISDPNTPQVDDASVFVDRFDINAEIFEDSNCLDFLALDEKNRSIEEAIGYLNSVIIAEGINYSNTYHVVNDGNITGILFYSEIPSEINFAMCSSISSNFHPEETIDCRSLRKDDSTILFTIPFRIEENILKARYLTECEY